MGEGGGGGELPRFVPLTSILSHGGLPARSRFGEGRGEDDFGDSLYVVHASTSSARTEYR